MSTYDHTNPESWFNDFSKNLDLMCKHAVSNAIVDTEDMPRVLEAISKQLGSMLYSYVDGNDDVRDALLHAITAQAAATYEIERSMKILLDAERLAENGVSHANS